MLRTSLNRLILATLSVAALAISPDACLTRPLSTQVPTTKTNFTAVIDQSAVDKLDLLFVIDNSASMGDKQAYLSQAIPDLITRLVTPNCVDPVTQTVYGASDPSGSGACAQGTVEFPPVHDMHLGIISTSLGPRLGNNYGNPATDLCDPTSTIVVNGVTLNNHNDDRAELLNRSGAAETPLADAGTSFYLNWFPNTTANMGKTPSAGAPAITSVATLESDFASLVQGVGNYGCGIESQLESWYRFLIQPDPYDSLALNGSHAQWVGVDTTILAQRQNFLRPDSLVAIIDLTDEDDSEIDVRSLDGQGYLWMNNNFDPPRGTDGCDENAASSGLLDAGSCTSCQLSTSATSDPNCQMGNFSAETDWGFNLNLRHAHMTQKYGVWPQFPIQRYVSGLTSAKVPDRNGEYPPGANYYVGTADCTNPLFAASLPDGSSTDPTTLCNLPRGPRTPDLIYYAHIGGVPHQLLQQDPTNPDSPQKETLANADWVKILGTDPVHFNYTGADPHMLESYAPRTGLPAPTAPQNPAMPNANPDPISGREWITNQGTGHVLAVDREYACIFPLATPRDCSNTTDESVAYACDCPAAAGLTYEELPPLCDATTQTSQIAAKAYPTIRELYLANLLGTQGIISSLCPIHVTPANNDMPPDPVYGYRPAMTAIVDRLKNSLATQCLPQQLTPASCGNVPCLVLETLPPGTTSCNASVGLSPPPSDVLQSFVAAQHTQWASNGGADAGLGPDPATLTTCEVTQLVPNGTFDPSCSTASAESTSYYQYIDFAAGSCAASTTPGWCYTTGTATGSSCSQAILFSASGTPPSGATVSLECIESTASVTGDGGT